TKLNKKPLSKEELSILENKEFINERLATVRDVFVFQCYTGLAYIDVFKLKKSDITKDEEGNLWIRTNRQKTDANITIPLLPKARQIMEKDKDHPVCTYKDIVLPVRSNQKMNDYVKTLGQEAGIDEPIRETYYQGNKRIDEVKPKHEHLSTHVGRRTFICTALYLSKIARLCLFSSTRRRSFVFLVTN
ncbi:site-specific integrase, partial [Empedobacter falsenii]|uniref:site-specific integrase n=1 Tax=Empedobacter falsenii TaxID=343874 RepID=UPI00257842FE